MATTTFSGPVKAGTIQNTTGTTYGDTGDVANTGWVVMSQTAAFAYNAGASNLLANLPAQSQIIDFIKLDTEGSELEILKGAENTLKSTVLGKRDPPEPSHNSPLLHLGFKPTHASKTNYPTILGLVLTHPECSVRLQPIIE